MIYLRALTKNDLKTINQWRRNRQLIDNLCTPFRFINIETDETWFEHYCQNSQNNIRLAICESDNHTHIGNIYLLNIDHLIRQAELHIFIADTTLQNKGYGKLAMQNCLNHGFNDLNLRRIILSVLSTNQKAIAFYECFGFKTEGIARQAAYKNGEYIDVHHMALLKKEYNRG